MPDFATLNDFGKALFLSSIIAFAVGIVCNVLVIALFFRRTLRKYSYSFYNQVKAVFDVIAILGIMLVCMKTTFGTTLVEIDAFFCHVSYFGRYVCQLGALGMIALISLDRYITVAFSASNWSKILGKKWFQALLVFGVFVYGCFSSLPLLLNPIFQDTFVDNTTKKVCSIDGDFSKKMQWMYVSNVLFFLLIANNIINVLLIRHMVLSRKRVALNNNGASGQRQTSRARSSKDRKFAIASIGMSVSAFVLRLPLGLLILVFTLNLVNFRLGITLITVGFILLMIECSSSFFINLRLNSVFYQEFMSVFGKGTREVSKTSKSVASTLAKPNKTLQSDQ